MKNLKRREGSPLRRGTLHASTEEEEGPLFVIAKKEEDKGPGLSEIGKKFWASNYAGCLFFFFSFEKRESCFALK